MDVRAQVDEMRARECGTTGKSARARVAAQAGDLLSYLLRGERKAAAAAAGSGAPPLTEESDVVAGPGAVGLRAPEGLDPVWGWTHDGSPLWTGRVVRMGG